MSESAKMLKSFFRGHGAKHFKARSASRDAETDRARAESILHSIESALDMAKAEHAGLNLRVNDALGRAAVTFGGDHDEHLTREPEDSHYLKLLGTEIEHGQRRLSELAVTIGHFQFLKTAVMTRFSDLGRR
jgi:hypothetical protein